MVLEQLAEAAQARLPATRLAPVERRFQELAELKARWVKVCEPLLGSEETPINPFRVTREFMKLVDPLQTIVLHDAGTRSEAQGSSPTIRADATGFNLQFDFYSGFDDPGLSGVFFLFLVVI